MAPSDVRIPVKYNGTFVGSIDQTPAGPGIYFTDAKMGLFIKNNFDLDKMNAAARSAAEGPTYPDFFELDPYMLPVKEAVGNLVQSIGEVRTVSASGAEKGVKPQRYSLIPKSALDAVGEVFNFGTQKYAPHNWRKGYEWSKSYDALQRHLNAWWEREENDSESGLSHLAHAAWHVLVLLAYSRDREKYGQYDDRYSA